MPRGGGNTGSKGLALMPDPMAELLPNALKARRKKLPAYQELERVKKIEEKKEKDRKALDTDHKAIHNADMKARELSVEVESLKYKASIAPPEDKEAADAAVEKAKADLHAATLEFNEAVRAAKNAAKKRREEEEADDEFGGRRRTRKRRHRKRKTQRRR